jgi:hypothetical protein
VPVKSLVFVALAIACSHGSEPLPGAQPVKSAEQPVVDACKKFVEHMDALSGFSTAETAVRSTCQKNSDEQIRCGIAASTIDELGLCLQISDPVRRERARPIMVSIRRTWPGSISVHDSIAGKPGCAFSGVMGAADAPLDDQHAVAAFALRSAAGSGDPDAILVTFERRAPNEPWRCAETDRPEVSCTQLAARCNGPP